MAAASVQPSPRTMSAMMNGRIPLASNQNAINSPYRGLAPVGGKRTRAQTEVSRETITGQPPAKRQILDISNDENAGSRTLTRQSQQMKDAEAKMFARRQGVRQPTSLEARLLAVKGAKVPQVQEKEDDQTRKAAEGMDSVRQWQAHYKKAFRGFIFFFDNVPDETHKKISQCLRQLHSRESKFYSKEVTHVVTTRPIPTGDAKTGSKDTYLEAAGQDQPQKTIDPALLNRNHVAPSAATQSRLAQDQSVVHRRLPDQTTDILHKARELNQKIWALEKLQRMLKALFTNDTEQPAQQLSRSHATANLNDTAAKEADLERLLRNEKISGPADRDATVASADMVPFRGNFIYIHDLNERYRPTMIRDYPKPTKGQEGKWPQLRVSSFGRCPWIEDPHYAKRMMAEEKRKEELARKQEAASAPRTRTRAAAEQDVTHVLVERQANLRRSPRKAAPEEKTKPLDPPKVPASRQNSTISTDGMPPLFGSAQLTKRGHVRYIGGEPVASGVQPSNITSAIRSQAISSTAISSTAPGARVGTSKELQNLKRKVLERGATVTSGSSYMNDVRAALNGDAPRGSKRKAQDVLEDIREEGVDEDARPRKSQPPRQVKKIIHKDPKPGYCENCRDKFEDFDEHIQTRKHRKFALDNSNWTELDQLISKLRRPRKA
ncbi:Dfp1/Him1, central region-domain-containing protein [Elsinoe ampelina]|uniref:Dfp1/Him1, central region-domain-containing protein n=1 Tax=Elsinoe ampelina TaxID=302913 RepID=A0A6A6GNK7_9PEZI|nr:Dfp1/Him1, central region-domain-containing protein [Elsinoe ampelina]